MKRYLRTGIGLFLRWVTKSGYIALPVGHLYTNFLIFELDLDMTETRNLKVTYEFSESNIIEKFSSWIYPMTLNFYVLHPNHTMDLRFIWEDTYVLRKFFLKLSFVFLIWKVKFMSLTFRDKSALYSAFGSLDIRFIIFALNPWRHAENILIIESTLASLI